MAKDDAAAIIIGPEVLTLLGSNWMSAMIEVLVEERDLLASMASIVCLLHHAFPHHYWTGFYRRVGERELLVGPYQGTMGCISISFDRGVCGACARERRAIIAIPSGSISIPRIRADRSTIRASSSGL